MFFIVFHLGLMSFEELPNILARFVGNETWFVLLYEKAIFIFFQVIYILWSHLLLNV